MKLLFRNYMPRVRSPHSSPHLCACPLTWPVPLTQRAPGPGMAACQCTALLGETCLWAAFTFPGCQPSEVAAASSAF